MLPTFHGKYYMTFHAVVEGEILFRLYYPAIQIMSLKVYSYPQVALSFPFYVAKMLHVATEFSPGIFAQN